MSKSRLGIQRILSIELAVHEATSWVNYFTRGFGFQHAAVTTGVMSESSGTRRHLLACGEVRILVSEPVHAASSIRAFLERHPEGICRIDFLVDDVHRAEEELIEHSAACLDHVRSEPIGGGTWKELCIATPLGDVEFGFVETSDAAGLSMPGMERCGSFDPRQNPLGIQGLDHFTSNVRTLMPVLAFYEHVMGFRRIWDMRFHGEDVKPGVGTGLTSVVMADERSGVRFATNEPLRPRFVQSQVQLHVEANRGPGVQQFALAVAEMKGAVDAATRGGVQFLPAPPAYYSALPARLRAAGSRYETENTDDLALYGVLVDADRGGHILQAFCRDQASQFGRPTAGPLLIELIERRGGQGFGEGNFRALFDAMQSQPAPLPR